MELVITHSKVYVETLEISYESYHSGEQYGDWGESKGFDVTKVSLTQEFCDECFDLGEPVVAGDKVHVVYVVYDTGDSFGRSTGNGELVWVFKDEELARKAVSEIEKNSEKYSIKIDLGENRSMTWSNPGAGYFENITLVKYETFVVQP